MHSIYIIEKIDDFRKYIGQTIDAKKRWRDHKYNARCCNADIDKKKYQYITRAMAKYGIENFTFRVHEENIPQEEINAKETYWIDFYQTRKHGVGFNLAPGGNTVGFGPDHPLYGKPAHNRLFSDEQEKEMCRIYVEEKIPARKVAERFGCCQRSVFRALYKYNIPILGNHYFSKGKIYSPDTLFKKGQEPPNKIFTPEQEKEICRKYTEELMSSSEIGKIYNCGKSLISDVLNRNNIARRNAGFYSAGKPPPNKLFSIEKEKEICDKYINEKLTTTKLSEIYNCNRTTIADTLAKYNIEIKKAGFHKKGKPVWSMRRFSPEQEKEICNKYLDEKLSMGKLSQIYNCDRTTVSDVLSRNNIEKRAR